MDKFLNSLTAEQKYAYGRILKGDNVLIFGQGGSGKSYLVEGIQDERTLCLAPTGMAAINMCSRARTIHSILQIGEKSLQAWNWEKVHQHISKKKIRLRKFFDNYDRIIIDECSMIVSGLLNTLIKTFNLVYETDSSILFNGKQIIFIMDPLQLPCVKNSSEPYLDMTIRQRRELAESDYIVNNPDFKRMFNKELGNIIHFTGNKRCDDYEWCEVLSACRTGFKECNPMEKKENLRILNERRVSMSECYDRHSENTNHTENDDYFSILDEHSNSEPSQNTELIEKYNKNTKTTLKKDNVQKINREKIQDLSKDDVLYYTERSVLISESEFLKGKSGSKNDLKKLMRNAINYMDDLGGYYSFKEDGVFYLNFPVIRGERVMLRTNQLDPRLKNGSLGEIVNIDTDRDDNIKRIDVSFEDIKEIINVKHIIFKHPEFSDIQIAAFPLIPAFAITIHKLQGQTIKSPLFINYSDIPWKELQYHLLYTAISRCKNKNDVYIISESDITEDYFPVDPIMYDWYLRHK
jgi:ATP-dependent exoDNAse (exonuclease V) alpha subunit